MKLKTILIFCALIHCHLFFTGCDRNVVNISDAKTSKEIENSKQFKDSLTSEFKKLIDDFVEISFDADIKNRADKLKKLEVSPAASESKTESVSIDEPAVIKTAAPSSLMAASLLIAPRTELKNYGRDYTIESQTAENAIVLLSFFDKKNPTNNELGSKWFFRFHLVNQNNEWKILEIESDPFTTKPKNKGTS